MKNVSYVGALGEKGGKNPRKDESVEMQGSERELHTPESQECDGFL